MFAENGFFTEKRLLAMDASFEPWLSAKLSENRYVGLLVDDDGLVIAGAGIFFAAFAPHFLDLQPVRPYLLNFYTSPKARGQGFGQAAAHRRGGGVPAA